MKNINNLFLLITAIFMSNYSAQASSDLSDSPTQIFSEVLTYNAPCGKRKKFCKGTVNFKDGSSYKGEFRYGEPHGQGIYHWFDGESYEGEFVNGLRHGRGKHKFNNNDEYKGEWEFGMMHG